MPNLYQRPIHIHHAKTGNSKAGNGIRKGIRKGILGMLGFTGIPKMPGVILGSQSDVCPGLQ